MSAYFKPQQLFPGKPPGSQWLGTSVGPWPGRGVLEKRKIFCSYRDPNLDRPAGSLVAISTSVVKWTFWICRRRRWRLWPDIAELSVRKATWRSSLDNAGKTTLGWKFWNWCLVGCTISRQRDIDFGYQLSIPYKKKIKSNFAIFDLRVRQYSLRATHCWQDLSYSHLYNSYALCTMQNILFRLHQHRLPVTHLEIALPPSQYYKCGGPTLNSCSTLTLEGSCIIFAIYIYIYTHSPTRYTM